MLCDFFNQVWLEFTGRSLEQEMGNGWAQDVHPDDLPTCLDIDVGRVAGEINVAMHHNEKRISLVIADNGVGIKESIDFNNSPGFGLTLISLLAKQLQGTIRKENDSGTKFTLEFGYSA